MPVDNEREMVVQSCLVEQQGFPEAEGFKASERLMNTLTSLQANTVGTVKLFSQTDVFTFYGVRKENVLQWETLK